MAALLDDEQKPLKKASVSNLNSDEDSREEENDEVFAIKRESFQSRVTTSRSIASASSQSDVSHSSFLLGRIAIFLYAFVSILMSSNFPKASQSSIKAEWIGWFKFYIAVNIIACIIGMCGVYLNKPKYVFACWISLFVTLILTGLLLIAYIFNEDKGVDREATIRCNEWLIDKTFSSKYTFDECFGKMKSQLIWTVIGLYAIYWFGGGFGIHIIKNTEQHIRQYVKLHQEDEIIEESQASFRSSDEFSELSRDAMERYDAITDNYENQAINEYDIHLDEMEHKKSI